MRRIHLSIRNIHIPQVTELTVHITIQILQIIHIQRKVVTLLFTVTSGQRRKLNWRLSVLLQFSKESSNGLFARYVYSLLAVIVFKQIQLFKNI